MWRITYKKVFLQELKKLPIDIKAQVEKFAFNELPSSENPVTLKQIKKLVGYTTYYRARFGDYRIGLIID